MRVYCLASRHDMEEFSREDLDWNEWNLFVAPLDKAPIVGSRVLMVSYSGHEGWSTLTHEDEWLLWRGDLGPGFYRDLIKAVFKEFITR